MPEDYVRALGYLTVMGWAVLFISFPPVSYLNTLDVLTRLLWMTITFAGASASFLGAMLRIDIKLEFPGLLFTLVGPLLYFASALYVTFIPVHGTGRVSAAFDIYTILPGILLLPRTVSLWLEAKRMKKITDNNRALKRELEQAKGFLGTAPGDKKK